MTRSRFAGAAIVLTLLLPAAPSAQDVTEPALKAAFIYNFIRFTEWPDPPPPSDPFIICVLGDNAVADALERAVKGRDFEGHRIVVSRLALSGSTATCRVLYLSGLTTIEGTRLLGRLQSPPVLTLSDMPRFTEAGGMAEFFFERGQLRFNIGQAVKRSRLQMSSRLLALANRYE